MDLNLFFKKNCRKIAICFFDVVCFFIIAAGVFGLSKIADVFPLIVFNRYWKGCLLLGVILFTVRIFSRLYNMIWRYTSTKAYLHIVIADFLTVILTVVLFAVLKWDYEFWAYGLIVSLNALLSLTVRFTYRLLYKKSNAKDLKKGNRINVAIAGAGQLGIFLLNELKSNPKSYYNPIFFIDKDLQKIGSEIAGVPVFGEKEAPKIIEKYEISEVIIAIAHLSNGGIRKLYDYYLSLGCKVKVYDSPTFENEEDIGIKKRVVREFQIEDLLFRDPLVINDHKSLGYYTGKTILVTGGGGSIGSEICRQIAKCKPAKLIIFDIYENNAYDIQQELRRKYGFELKLSVEIGSVRDRIRLECIFKNYQPQIVFHAAAHKHVPLMEQSGCEAIKNNVIGTYNTADMAEKYNAEKFILISTDKAVNPTNIMGASKRLCEMVVQCRVDSKTNFAAVRFGNVLGSNGSVIPLFKKQIASGGPVTITDKRIVRYFMTIPEASQLVIRAGAMAKKGELFVLDMGKPVKIYDLAINMIKLSGYEPNVDIQIQEIGLRPGEKLYEELLMANEKMDKTENDMIFIEKDAPLSRQEVEEKVQLLLGVIDRTNMQLGSAELIQAIKVVVPTFRTPKDVNAKASEASEMKQAEAV